MDKDRGVGNSSDFVKKKREKIREDTQKKVFLVVEPLRGGGGQTPRTTMKNKNNDHTLMRHKKILCML